MTKRKRQLRQADLRHEQGATHHRRAPRVCPTCGTRRVEDDRSYTERVLAISDHPLVALLRFHDRQGANSGTPGESDRLLAWVDGTRTVRGERRAAAVALARGFAERRPVLAMLVAQAVVEGISARELAEELGIDDHTVGKMLDRGHMIIRQAAAESGLYEQGT